MMNDNYYFPGVTLLITHYNRSSSLERLLSNFQKLSCRFEEIVVSDDGSKPEHKEHLNTLKEIYNFRLVTGEKNGGFAINMNKGQDAVRTPYTLYVQEDFTVKDVFPEHLLDALEFMNKDNSLDYVRFWSFYRYPTLKPFGKGFSQTYYNPWNLNHRKFFMYSDNPHLRRTTFLQKFGRYQEDIDGNISEYRMSLAFIRKGGKGLFYNEYETLFDHKNSAEEPSSFKRSAWRQSKNPVSRFIRWMYLKYKFAKCWWELRFLELPTLPK